MAAAAQQRSAAGSWRAFSTSRPSIFLRAQQQQRSGARRSRAVAAAATSGEQQAQQRIELKLPRQPHAHMLISATEVPAFIQRDDMMDQIYRWALIEAGEGGLRNFGMPMKVEPTYFEESLWGFDIEIIKEGVKKADLGINFDNEIVLKHEWVGRDEEGFPRMEGNAESVSGKNLEIWCARRRPWDASFFWGDFLGRRIRVFSSSKQPTQLNSTRLENQHNHNHNLRPKRAQEGQRREGRRGHALDDPRLLQRPGDCAQQVLRLWLRLRRGPLREEGGRRWWWWWRGSDGRPLVPAGARGGGEGEKALCVSVCGCARSLGPRRLRGGRSRATAHQEAPPPPFSLSLSQPLFPRARCC